MDKLIIIAAVVGCVFITISLLVYVFKLLFSWVVIRNYQKGLKYSRGRFVGIVEAGGYLIFKPFTSIEVIDVRPQFTVITGQEVLTSDGIGLKFSIAVKYEIVDPVAALQSVQSYYEALYIIVQVALRELVSAGNVDELLENRQSFDKLLMQKCEKQCEEFGLRLHFASIRDITFPGDLKKTFAQVVNARKEGQAALERARGETAALRNLANAAALLRDNPSLLQLRAIQSVGGTSGNTLVMGVPVTDPVATKKGPDAKGKE
jgi:regulator of protease activity HflC (stomatin/prohibitin superfamily)